MSNNGFVIHELQGTKKDFVGAWVTRLFLMLAASVITWLCKLILAAVMYLVNTLPPMQADVNTLKSDVKSLRENTATKSELAEAEKRVRTEISEQIRKTKTRVVTP